MLKNRTFSIFLLLILPLTLIFLSSYFKSAKGEYHIYRYYDPSYAYLINSLNIAQLNGSSVGHIDHPGTTVQVIGAITIHIAHELKFQNENLVQSVFKNPEYYLSSINLALIFIIAVSLFILGYIIYEKLDICAGIIFQLTPFYSLNIFYSLTNVSAEPLWIFTLLLFITVTISFVNDNEITENNNFKYVIGFSIICGFGLATKILILPLLIIPLILIKKISYKILYIIFSLLAFVIFVMPAINHDNSLKFFTWIKDLIIHSGDHGIGDDNFINKTRFLTNIKKILISEPSFSFSYLLLSLILLLQLFKKYKFIIRANKYFKLLIAIFITMTIQILMVSKQFGIYYMLTAVMLSVTSLFIVNSIANDIYPNFFKNKKYLYLIIILIILSVPAIKSDYNRLVSYQFTRAEYINTISFVKENYKDLPVITSIRTSDKEHALYFGVTYSGSEKEKYISALQFLYPDFYPYNSKSNNFNSINKLKDYNKLIFLCRNENINLDFIQLIKQITGKKNAAYESVFTNESGYRIYEINLSE